MDIRKIKKLIELVQASDITELEIKEGEESIRLCRQPAVSASGQKAGVTLVSSTDAGEPSEQEDYDEETLLRSPMVGTFYLAPAVDAAPLVKLGQRVEQGEPVCIIEAMKMMNQIQAPHAGVVTALLCQSGDGVEFDQPLMVIE
ncbi:acetyl-CoA carboxylase biotin carboxyl carrier protein [Shewanella alkalitolerans]|uniref:acetyl-CoA carboxylase biotin carboxyl carrier protein n=1 Tax=Shewanella alkalitolerans TaxID=2864209 RepID=UPI001C661B30|nr:acetyl-CoA carboxylase biotin carboxyl carrier protein [Shewanella alkalitolerans]QYJ97229.1 acetyl-CoA carboxylase biotin carboxyl carrier protein [Shewanella alkalitolerans]